MQIYLIISNFIPKKLVKCDYFMHLNKFRVKSSVNKIKKYEKQKTKSKRK